MQLSQRQGKGEFPLISQNHDIIVDDKNRSCTDILCLFLFLVFAAIFAALLIYSLVKGDASKVFAVYNSNQIRCQATSFPYGYFADSKSLVNAICVSECPNSQQQPISCLVDQVNCKTGTFSNTIKTSAFDNICVPDSRDFSEFFTYNTYATWSYDLQKGYLVLVGAALLAMAASLFFLVVVRCCTGIIIWLTIIICIGGMLIMGIFFILQAKGVNISSFIKYSQDTVSYNSLIIIGSGLIITSVLILLLVICLRTRIMQGSKAVELGAIFLLQNCCIIILPITQAIVISATIAAIAIGAVYLLSLGQFSFPNNNAFPTVILSTDNIFMISFFLAGGFWVMFYFHGCNHFMVSSAVAIWYFNHQSRYTLGSPLCDSLRRLIRYSSGSVACTALINCVLFILKILAHIFSFEAKEEDHHCIAYCLKCLNCLFCIFRIFLRFLCDGTYVQIAVTGKGYFRSTLRAYNIVTENSAKVVITDSISIFFTVLGILGISLGVSVAAYFVCLQLEYYATVLTDPIIITIVSGLIGFVVACIYLSMIDLSAQSVLQCYIIDHLHHNGATKYASPKITQILIIKE